MAISRLTKTEYIKKFYAVKFGYCLPLIGSESSVFITNSNMFYPKATVGHWCSRFQLTEFMDIGHGQCVKSKHKHGACKHPTVL